MSKERESLIKSLKKKSSVERKITIESNKVDKKTSSKNPTKNIVEIKKMKNELKNKLMHF